MSARRTKQPSGKGTAGAYRAVHTRKRRKAPLVSSPYRSNPQDFSSSAVQLGADGLWHTRPANYLVWAIVTTVLFMPLGIASIVFATQVNRKWAMGDVAGAQAASTHAKDFAVWSAIVAIIALMLYLGLANMLALTSGS